MVTLALRRGFTMLEVMIVVTIIAILAAVVVPRFGGLTEEARSSAAVSAVSGVRTSISAFRTRRILTGDTPFPTLAELTTEGVVMQQGLPANPYTGVRGVRAVSRADADARAVASSAQYGWCYFVDNDDEPPRAILYLNSEDETRVPNESGGYVTANRL
ncbi:MAG: pilin [Phycisphaeraceae bacterium]|nr:pilin [Phycisphaeraceae bacterium]